VREILNAILRAGTCRVVIVSGRWTRDLLPLLGLDQQPEIWGSHGLERLFPDGRRETVLLSEKVTGGLAEARVWMAERNLQDLGEYKPGCLALHWRGLPPERVEQLRAQIAPAWSQLVKQTGLELIEFDGGLELRAPGRDKGDAVTTILNEEGPEAVVAYLGDDQTDEDAFAVLMGKGLGILVREKWRPTKAGLWLRPPEQLLTFLGRWELNCRG
jgi:trehalose-phosphatase